MIRLFAITALLTYAFLSGLGHAKAESNCNADYNALEASLWHDRADHQAWIDYLYQYPNAYIPSDVVSIDVQIQKVTLYDWRIWSVYAVAIGDYSQFDSLIADFSYSRDVHLWWANNEPSISSRTLGGLDARTSDLNAATEYDYRISLLNSLTIECN